MHVNEMSFSRINMWVTELSGEVLDTSPEARCRYKVKKDLAFVFLFPAKIKVRLEKLEKQFGTLDQAASIGMG